MKKQLLAGVITASTLAIAFIPTSAQAFSVGKYKLGSHIDGSQRPPAYGLRLDGLLTGDTNEEYTFDFDHSMSNVFLEYKPDHTIHIYGKAYGGEDNGNSYKTGTTDVWNIDFKYSGVQTVTNPSNKADNDLIALLGKGQISSTNFGTYDLAAQTATEKGVNFAFRFGDEKNDLGHRGYQGISGWGWVNHGKDIDGIVGNNAQNHIYASDWLFTAKPVPTPALLPGLIGMGVASLRKKKKQVGEIA
jgi:hypothetical protein